jgi:hypothetical protein
MHAAPQPLHRAARAVACALARLALQTTPALPTFEVGRAYRHLYGDAEIVVLSISRTLEGRTAVTAQITKDDQPEQVGAVLAFIVAADAGVWR